MMSNKMPYIIFAILAITTIIITLIIVEDRQYDTPADRMNNAAKKLSDGIDDAADELSPPRTPAEKMDNLLENMGDDIKDATRH